MSTIPGSAGDDFLTGTPGDDSITGLGGDDWLTGGAGNDTIDGGGNGSRGDTVDYSSANSGVQVDLVTCIATDGLGGTDQVFNVEHIQGSSFGDTLLGHSGTNWFFPGGGNDSVDGRGGQDVVFYESSTSGVIVNLLAGTASGAAIGSDTLTSIEALHASHHDDVVTMSNSAAYVFLRAGDDLATGGNGDDGFIGGSGDDTMHGGAGFDSVDYLEEMYDPETATGQGVSVNLATGTATDNWGDTDTFTGIELVSGSSHDDLLVGGNPANGTGATDGFEGFTGNGGNDTIDGGAGYDRASYQNSPSAVNVSLGGTSAGTAQDGFGGTDTLISIEEVRASSHGDTLNGSDESVFESFEGRGGNDIIDGGGGTADRLSFQTSPSGVVVDIGAGTASDGWGGTDTFTNIENVRGSESGDTLIGDAGPNELDARGGNDSLVGGAGADHLRGWGGNDTLDGGANLNPEFTSNVSPEYDVASFVDGATGGVTVILGATGAAGTATGSGTGTDVLIDIEMVVGSAYNDVISGTNRDMREIIRGGLGDDTLSGGHSSGSDPGFDFVDYRFAAGAVQVDLGAGSATGADGTDQLNGFEGVFGSSHNDHIVGDGALNYLDGREGNDTIDGGGGHDFAAYLFLTSGGVNVDLAAATAICGSGTDTLISIEAARGSEQADTLAGDGQDNTLEGRAGNDTISGRAGDDTLHGGLGDDVLDGGDNDTDTGDWLSYQSADGPVSVNLAAGTASGADGSDVVANFEAVMGSDHADTLTGSGGNDVLRGNEGNDIIAGGGGIDSLDYGDASSGVTVSLASGTSSGADGADSFTGMENIRGSAYADSLTGDAGDNVLRGNAGNDTLAGGAGNDTVGYDGASGSVTVNLATGTASGADGNDTFTGIENATGSSGHGDVLVGDASANRLEGLGGNDSLQASGGNDTLYGGAGNDTLDGGAGFDTAVFTGNVSQYTITYDPLDDSLIIVEGPEGRDTLIDVEALQFADGTFIFDSGTEEDDEIEGGDADEVISGRGGNDRVRGGGGNDALFGDDGDDDLQGDEGDDLLDGGTGNDTLAGGEGNDTYVVDSEGDDVTEPDSIVEMPAGVGAQLGVGGGIDRVIAGINYTLGNAIEHLDLASGGGALAGTGNALANIITGNESDNRLTGAGGNDSIAGGDGIDTAVYEGTRAQYAVALGSSASVSAQASDEGTDTLAGVERLQFADVKLAIDLDGNAGEVAKIIGIVFGSAAVAQPSLAAIGLSLRDGGFEYEALMGLALDVALGEDATNAQVASLLYTNLFGVAPDSGTRDAIAGWLDQGVYTPEGLALLAADIMGVPAAAQNGLAYA